MAYQIVVNPLIVIVLVLVHPDLGQPYRILPHHILAILPLIRAPLSVIKRLTLARVDNS